MLIFVNKLLVIFILYNILYMHQKSAIVAELL